MIRSIPCPIILNDIFLSEIGTCKKNGSLMFMQVSTQRPFTCATSIFGERKWDLICHIRMLLALYNPCMASFFLIIYPMGDIGVKDQCCCNPSFGLVTKAKGLQRCGPRRSPGVTSHIPGSVGKCEGVNPHTPKVTPTLGDGVPVDSQNFREQF